MKTKKTGVVLLAIIVAVVSAQAEVIIQDTFEDAGAAGSSITNSVLNVGAGTWEGTLQSNGGNIMRASDDGATLEGAAIALPDFNVGDIITIKARAARTDDTTWFGIGFSDSADISSMASYTPWATFNAVNGNVTAFGGGSTANSTGALTRDSGGVGAAVTSMEFTYDTGAGTVTTVYGGETVQDAVSFTVPESTTLDYAFFVMANADAGPGAGGSYLVSYEVSVVPEPATLGLMAGAGAFLLVLRRRMM